jgi:diguanylate cyclase (GGDEF)-like protein
LRRGERGEVALFDEAATWTGVGALALSAAVLALGIILLARWRRAAAGEIAEIRATGERTETLLTALRRALGDAQNEGRRLAALGQVGTTLDLDAALERALRAVTQLTDADAAMIVLRHEEEEPITATYGLTEEESARDLLGLPPEAGRARAVKLSYLYTPEETANDAFRLSGGVGVPLTAEHGERVGTLAIFWRREERALDNADLARFEELAETFGPALQNARLYSEARRLADTDPLTNLRNRRYFNERLRRECARARRYGRALGLLLFEAADEIDDLFAAGGRIQGVVRSTDIACHLGEGRFAVIMPEAAEADVERLHRRLQFALGGRVDNGDGAVRIRAGLVELRGEDDAATLLRRAESALERIRQASEEPATKL